MTLTKDIKLNIVALTLEGISLCILSTKIGLTKENIINLFVGIFSETKEISIFLTKPDLVITKYSSYFIFSIFLYPF